MHDKLSGAMEELIINRVTESSLITIDLDDLIDTSSIQLIDLKDCLYKGVILREIDFRAFVKDHDWQQYQNKNVGIMCSTDAIIPSWAYMIIASKLADIARLVTEGDRLQVEREIIQKSFAGFDPKRYQDKKIVIKGCGSLQLRDFAYTKITALLVPVVSSLMYGEPCSTVPVYKKQKK